MVGGHKAAHVVEGGALGKVVTNGEIGKSVGHQIFIFVPFFKFGNAFFRCFEIINKGRLNNFFRVIFIRLLIAAITQIRQEIHNIRQFSIGVKSIEALYGKLFYITRANTHLAALFKNFSCSFYNSYS